MCFSKHFNYIIYWKKANNCLLKNATLEEFYDCIEKSIDGEIVFSSEVKAMISKPEISDFKKLPSLTRREKEILILISKGKNSQEIANSFFEFFNGSNS